MPAGNRRTLRKTAENVSAVSPQSGFVKLLAKITQTQNRQKTQRKQNGAQGRSRTTDTAIFQSHALPAELPGHRWKRRRLAEIGGPIKHPPAHHPPPAPERCSGR